MIWSKAPGHNWQNMVSTSCLYLSTRKAKQRLYKISGDDQYLPNSRSRIWKFKWKLAVPRKFKLMSIFTNRTYLIWTAFTSDDTSTRQNATFVLRYPFNGSGYAPCSLGGIFYKTFQTIRLEGPIGYLSMLMYKFGPSRQILGFDVLQVHFHKHFGLQVSGEVPRLPWPVRVARWSWEAGCRGTDSEE